MSSWRKGLTKEDPRIKKQTETRTLRMQMGLIKPYRFNKCPNNCEKEITNFLKTAFPDFRFTGDLSFFIDDLNPDWVNERDKIIIEFYGCKWHGCPKCGLENPYSEKFFKKSMERIKRFSKFGYSTIIIWEHEFRKEDWKRLLSERLQKIYEGIKF